ncbi:type I restriction endonuclease subunit S [Aeromonas dhakensis]|uniref:restriction endonuclease subunit S n=1 Tax=Aeromonas dhakensis TaxID=196024 RepID=UPI00111B1825|nr:restriction endonuclease subunit S [Aeromonas dhakensis]TNI55998.1 type I restriction endonuclease subunit S [Aeromonas dhakensis]
MAAQDFPIEWVSARISDISAKCEQRTPEEIEEFVYVDIGSIDRVLKKIATPQMLYGHEVPSRARKVINSGDVLVSLTRPNLNAVSLVPDQLNGQIASTGFEVIKPIGVDSRFIFNITRSRHFIDSISGAVQGALYPAAKSSDVQNYKIPLPSAAEQKEIADRLDILLAQVEATQARLARIPDIIKQFRQSVLAAAVSGKLTEDWRGTSSIDISHPSMSIGSESESAPKGWKWEKLTRLAILESGHTPRKSVPEYWENGDVYWLSLQDIREANGTIIKNTKFKPTMKGIENSSARLLPEGTVCFCRDISVGYVTIMGKEMSTTQHFANWICGDELNNKFLMYSFMAAKDHLLNSGQGTTVKTIYMPALKDLRILLPKVEEQTEIVRRVEQLFAYADNLEQQAKAAKARVDNLTQAILAKAFRGELTADWRAANPHLSSGDNSAAALLARIQAERATAKPRKRASKPAISPTSSGVPQ